MSEAFESVTLSGEAVVQNREGSLLTVRVTNGVCQVHRRKTSLIMDSSHG